MRVALTGGTGFIGRYLIHHLLDDGHSLRCWRRESSDISGLPENDRIEWVGGSLTEPEAASRLISGCDALVHSAFWHPTGGFQRDIGDLLEFAETNVIGSLRLFHEAIETGCERIVYLSSCAVHDRILGDRPLDENHPTRASNHYGAHKAAVEQFVHSCGFGEGVPICAVRPTGVYGVDHPWDHSKWADLIGQVTRGETVHCDTGGKEVHASDVARAVGLLLNADAETIRGETFNCYDRYVSRYEVAHLARDLSGSSTEITGEKTAPKNQIVTEKLRALGMTFGGDDLLRKTIGELVEAVRGN